MTMSTICKRFLILFVLVAFNANNLNAMLKIPRVFYKPKFYKKTFHTPSFISSKNANKLYIFGGITGLLTGIVTYQFVNFNQAIPEETNTSSDYPPELFRKFRFDPAANTELLKQALLKLDYEYADKFSDEKLILRAILG